MSGECVIYQRLVSTTEDFTISPSAVGFGVCPFGFSIMGSWCIKVVTDKLNMHSAREHCRDHNADLITLETQAKIGKFRDFMVANDYGYGYEFFLCGVSEVNGEWQWITGKTFSSNSDVWCPNEPNVVSERCAAIEFDCIRDVQCDTVEKFVCEIHF
ncbi:C-type lectin domain family 6 member A-like [Haliotis rubra]|uniref:C-type lectin domain family 6 member A-like n=1 Tax=Haliotis rubra TaxID=36100 RepID=UPI001EE608C8|nr:C-type lectin domain family 6 member A-like [Haliotis rubra]